MDIEILNKKVYEFATTSDLQRMSELLNEIIEHYLEMYSYERQRFADANEVDLNDYGQDILLSNYGKYLQGLFLGLRDRSVAKLEELQESLADGITLTMIAFVVNAFNVINQTESANVIQTAQLGVVQQIQSSNTDVRITKTWVAYPKCCKICKALDGMTIPVEENFLVNGQVVDLKDGTKFVYNYVDRTVAVAHPNDRCRIEFNLEKD